MGLDSDRTETYQSPNASINMTHRVGTIYADRARLVEALGEPHETDGDKTTMEWIFTTPEGVATLYDYWWNGEGEWSVGGHSEAVVAHVQEYVNLALKGEL